jgi:hypothetical protein
MVMENENSNTEESRNIFPKVHDEAIVEGIDDSTDMDGDGSPD